MNDYAITAEKVLHTYGNGGRVLDGLSFSVRKAECSIIIGPNGSGKSTLMKVLAGLIRPDEGKIDILGRPLRNYSRRELAQRIAYVPQQVPADFPFLVADVVLFGRAPHLGTFGMESEADRELARQSMVFTEVAHLSGRRIDQLSGGERQRVFIARAVCQEPEIMLLDEPTAALDIAHQLRVMDLMEKLKTGKRITIVMISHDINLAAMYADSLLLLNKGKAVAYGNPGEVLSYSTLEAAYGCPLLVDKNPLGPMPRVTPVPGRYLVAAASSSKE